MTLTRYRRGAGRLPFRWQTVFSREVGGRSGAKLLQRTFFSAPGLTAALHWNFIRSGPLIGLELTGNWWKGGEGHASKERDGERVKSKTGQQVSH